MDSPESRESPPSLILDKPKLYELIPAILEVAHKWENFMDEKKDENITRIRNRFDYPQMHDNNATIPLLAIEVAVRKVEAEFKDIIDGWKLLSLIHI